MITQVGSPTTPTTPSTPSIQNKGTSKPKVGNFYGIIWGRGDNTDTHSVLIMNMFKERWSTFSNELQQKLMNNKHLVVIQKNTETGKIGIAIHKTISQEIQKNGLESVVFDQILLSSSDFSVTEISDDSFYKRIQDTFLARMTS